MPRSRPAASVALSGLLLACSSPGTVSPDAGAHPRDTGFVSDSTHVESGAADAGHDAGQPDAHDSRDTGVATDARGDGSSGHHAASAIEHLVLIVQENHSFDNYFGLYCTAATGSNPTCNAGPACCEAAPAMDPSGATPVTLDDSTNSTYNPNHVQACELQEIDNGKMDKFVTGTSCSSAGNLAYAGSAAVGGYWQLAAGGALADRYFQPIAGASTSNDMYLARAKFVFLDDDYEAPSKGAFCQGGAEMSYTDPTIADLLLATGGTFGVYAAGYAASVGASPECPPISPACPAQVGGYPCSYDPGDIPFEYFPSLRDNPLYMKDFTQLASDLSGNALPDFAFVKAIGYLTEHPGFGDTISGGQTFVQGVIDAVEASPYAANTLILITWDESGGYFDHIAPPPTSPVDSEPYGARIPLLAVGPFAKKNYVSHVTMEHSSVVTFVEWNWLGQQTGQLLTRDAVVHNIGSLLDPTATVVGVPE